RVINIDQIRQIFAETERGQFARDWMQEFALGMPTLHRLRRAAAQSGMEQTGREWRARFGT
ncbi:MAG: ketol-acid reductoisomerase, partial [Phycisphaerae bacterium]|nr:ketol-acid reductoisomerase [Phycisphaerae bacterium]